MKELSIEEKAKRYDEALTKARNIVSSINVGLIGKDSFEAVFPELKESEDERMKDIITKALCTNQAQEEIEKYGINAIDCVAWLEEQGEQKPADDEMIALLRTEYEKGRADAIAEMQKPWSEEDKETLKDIITSMTNLKDSATSDALRYIYNSKIDWLKSLRPQSHWKPSDEQMNGLKEAIEFLGCTKTRREQLQSLYEQLKKLREE